MCLLCIYTHFCVEIVFIFTFFENYQDLLFKHRGNLGNYCSKCNGRIVSLTIANLKFKKKRKTDAYIFIHPQNLNQIVNAKLYFYKNDVIRAQ